MPLVAQPTTGLYPSIEDVFNSVRVHLNDTFKGATGTLGEGRIFIDTWSPSITILNLALARFSRDLEHYGAPVTRTEVFALMSDVLEGGGLTPINGPLGLGAPDPSVQVYMNFEGYWDGQILNKQLGLPFDMILPLKIEERLGGTNLPFVPLREATFGLYAVNQLANSLGAWEWRNDGLFFNGCTQAMDIRIRYTAGFPRYPLNLPPKQPTTPGAPWFGNTLIPVLDSLEPLSYLVAYIFASPRLPVGGAKELEANYTAVMLKIANRYIKQQQATPVARKSTIEGDDNDWWGGGGGIA